MASFATTSTSASAPISAPAPARVHDSPRNSLAEHGAALDDFFGSPRRPAQIPASTAPLDIEASLLPPSYASASDSASAFELPPYESVAVPDTLARHLFKFGFLFPLFWLLGSFLLITTLAEPAEWSESKSVLERATLMRELRIAERKWARRCLIAWSLFCFVLVTGVVTVVLVVKFT